MYGICSVCTYKMPLFCAERRGHIEEGKVISGGYLIIYGDGGFAVHDCCPSLHDEALSSGDIFGTELKRGLPGLARLGAWEPRACFDF
jgi:hypothetical protein